MKTPKDIVLEIYASDAIRNPEAMKNFLHPEAVVEWNSSKGFLKLDYESVIEMTGELERSYLNSRAEIHHILAENNLVTVRFTHYVTAIENPGEETALAKFFIIWEIKDGQLYRGFQMSQLP